MHFVLQMLNREPLVLWKPQKGKQAHCNRLAHLRDPGFRRCPVFSISFHVRLFRSVDHLWKFYCCQLIFWTEFACSLPLVITERVNAEEKHKCLNVFIFILFFLWTTFWLPFFLSNLFEGTLNWGKIVIFVHLSCHSSTFNIIFWL